MENGFITLVCCGKPWRGSPNGPFRESAYQRFPQPAISPGAVGVQLFSGTSVAITARSPSSFMPCAIAIRIDQQEGGYCDTIPAAS
jgi:hypothetical protein